MQGEGIIRSIKREHNSSDTFRRFKTRAKNLAREKIRGETSVDRSRRIEFLSKFDRIDDHFTRSNDLYLFFFFFFLHESMNGNQIFHPRKQRTTMCVQQPSWRLRRGKKDREKEGEKETVRAREREKERESMLCISS